MVVFGFNHANVTKSMGLLHIWHSILPFCVVGSLHLNHHSHYTILVQSGGHQLAFALHPQIRTWVTKSECVQDVSLTVSDSSSLSHRVKLKI